MLFVGLDWGEASHAVCLLDETGRVLAQQAVPHTLAGVTALHTLIAGHTTDPADVVVGLETEQGLLVSSLLAAGYQLYAINPLSVSRYRDRQHVSGAKSDPGDARVLADLVRTDRQQHHPMAGDTAAVTALAVITRQHQELIQDRQRHTNQLRSALVQFYPAALAAFGQHLDAPEAVAVLQRAPTPAQGRRLSVRHLVGILRAAGRQRGIEQRAQAIQAALRTPQLELPTTMADAYGTTVAAQAHLIALLTAQIAVLEAELTQRFETHPDAELIDSLPGLGAVLGARVLAEFGDDPTRYADSKARKCYAGTAPVTRASGRTRRVVRRRACNPWLAGTCSWWAFTALQTSPGARALYDAQKAKGKSHQQALRTVANRLVGLLHGCLKTRTGYVETIAWPTLPAAVETAEPAETPTKFGKTTGPPPGSLDSVAASA